MLGFVPRTRPINSSSIRARWRMGKRPLVTAGLSFVGVIALININTFYAYANNYWEHQKKMWACVGIYQATNNLTPMTDTQIQARCEHIVDAPEPVFDDDGN